jgi:hypothetical protein
MRRIADLARGPSFGVLLADEKAAKCWLRMAASAQSVGKPAVPTIY